MLRILASLWKSLAFFVLAVAIFWLPKDVQDYGQAAKPWQKVTALVDQNGALWAVCFLLGAWLLWADVRPFWKARFAPRFPERHRRVLQDLAGRLAEAKEVAFRYPAMALAPNERLAAQTAFETPYRQALSLVEQVSYDQPTAVTVRDFLHVCSVIFTDGLDRQDTREYRREAEAMSGPIFRALHAGESINRDAIPLPQWMENAGVGSKP